jgi:hypothetical protein
MLALCTSRWKYFLQQQKHFLTSFRTLISMRVAPGTYYFIIFAGGSSAAAACSAYIAAGHVRDVTWASIFSALPEDVRNFKCVQGGVDAGVAAWRKDAPLLMLCRAACVWIKKEEKRRYSERDNSPCVSVLLLLAPNYS